MLVRFEKTRIWPLVLARTRSEAPHRMDAKKPPTRPTAVTDVIAPVSTSSRRVCSRSMSLVERASLAAMANDRGRVSLCASHLMLSEARVTNF